MRCRLDLVSDTNVVDQVGENRVAGTRLQDSNVEVCPVCSKNLGIIVREGSVYR